MRIMLNRMERLAATGALDRFQSEVNEARGRCNSDLLQILEEHGYHYLPEGIRATRDDTGYVAVIEWDVETTTQESAQDG